MPQRALREAGVPRRGRPRPGPVELHERERRRTELEITESRGVASSSRRARLRLRQSAGRDADVAQQGAARALGVGALRRALVLRHRLRGEADRQQVQRRPQLPLRADRPAAAAVAAAADAAAAEPAAVARRSSPRASRARVHAAVLRDGARVRAPRARRATEFVVNSTVNGDYLLHGACSPLSRRAARGDGYFRCANVFPRTLALDGVYAARRRRRPPWATPVTRRRLRRRDAACSEGGVPLLSATRPTAPTAAAPARPRAAERAGQPAVAVAAAASAGLLDDLRRRRRADFDPPPVAELLFQDRKPDDLEDRALPVLRHRQRARHRLRRIRRVRCGHDGVGALGRHHPAPRQVLAGRRLLRLRRARPGGRGGRRDQAADDGDGRRRPAPTRARCCT